MKKKETKEVDTLDPKESLYVRSSENPVIDWIVRFVKGFLIGLAAILPGVSGGVLLVVFGFYAAFINFLAHPKRKFGKNISYFLPVILGGLLGIFVFSIVVTDLFERFEVLAIALFLGFVAGTIPSLFKSAREKSTDKKNHIGTLIITAIIFLVVMTSASKFLDLNLEGNFLVWIFAGFLVGFGVVVPGVSTSNFLLYFNLYDKMAKGIADLDAGVIIPLVIGLLLCIFGFSKVMSNLFENHYGIMSHIVIGLVIGSTIAIIFTHVVPKVNASVASAAGISMTTLVLLTIAAFALGAIISLVATKLESRVDRD